MGLRSTIFFQQSIAVRDLVLIPSGQFLVDSLELKSGVILQGAGQFSSVILHTGNSSRCIYNEKGHHNRWVGIRELTVIGSDNKGTYTEGIHLFEANYSSYINRITIRGFTQNIVLEDCWTFQLTRSHLFKAHRNNLTILNGTAMEISGNRIDGAGKSNIQISRSKRYRNTGILIRNNAIQQAQEYGLYCRDTNSLLLEGNFFEANNRNGGFAFVYIEGPQTSKHCLIHSTSNYFSGANKSAPNSVGIFLKGNVKSFSSNQDYFSGSMGYGIYSVDLQSKEFVISGTTFHSKSDLKLPSDIKIIN